MSTTERIPHPLTDRARRNPWVIEPELPPGDVEGVHVDEETTRAQLKQLRSETAGLIGALAAELAALRPVLVRDPSTEASYVAAMHRLDAAKRTSVEVEAALGRLDEGAYGWCLSCLEPIHRDRLRVRPQASHCVRCS